MSMLDGTGIGERVNTKGADAWLQNGRHVQLFIDGRWAEASSGETFQIINPAMEAVEATVCRAGEADTKRAIDAAQRGFKTWRREPAWHRAKILANAALMVDRSRHQLAERIVRDCGKPMVQALAEVATSVEVIDWYAGEAKRIFGDVLTGRQAGTVFQTVYEPVGVCAGFSAWNFPILLVVRKLAAALAAGCAIICRPAEEGSACAAALFRCFIEAGVPPGVINLLTGPPEPISTLIMKSPVVRKISFTGSIPVGRHLIRASADTLKRVTMELGGHAPVIIFEDADPTAIAEGAALAKFRNAGQVCASPTRFFVHRAHGEAFAEAFVKAAKKLKLGNGLDESVDVGPLISSLRRNQVEALVAQTRAEGGILACGGRRPPMLKKGYFFEPTIFTRMKDTMTAMTQEPFGPLALITDFESFDEVIARANGLCYGLAGYVFTNSLKTAHRAIAALRAGTVTINGWTASFPEMPFGGVKYSGCGREGGRQGIFDYLDTKSVSLSFG